METKQNYTDVEIIELVIGTLSNISVPVSLKRQIADPIEGSISNLILLHDAIMKNMQQKAQKEQEEVAPEEIDLGEIDLGEEQEDA